MESFSLEKYKDIADISTKFGKIGYWYCDKLTEEEEVSQEWAELIGYTREELTPMTDKLFYDLIHPDDLEKSTFKSCELYNGKVDFMENELRMRHKDGHYVWILSRGKVKSYENGKVKLVMGVHISIDKQKQDQEKLVNYVKSAISTFAFIVENIDEYTSVHQNNVSNICVDIAKKMGFPEEKLLPMWAAGKLHDIGKISCPLGLLNKKGKLTIDEKEILNKHAYDGYMLLRKLEFDFPLAEIVYQHHERLDGTGYPRGLKAEEILLETQILSVADVLDAMINERPYRKALKESVVLDELISNSGILYNKEIVDIAVDIVKEHYHPKN